MKRKPRSSGKKEQVDIDEILPQYDFSRSRPNKYAARYAAGSSVVVLEPDVAAVFPSAGEVNEALRALAGHPETPAAPNGFPPCRMRTRRAPVFRSL